MLQTKLTADGETLSELNVEARTLLAFRAREEAVGALLPAGWVASPAEAGPTKGANLLLIFTDRLLVQGHDELPLPGQETNELAVAAVPAHHPASGVRGVVIVYGLSARPAGAPGPYGVFKHADAEARVERIIRSGPGESREGDETWVFAGSDGTRLSLRLRYARAVPARTEQMTPAFSAADPSFYRIYRADQGAFALPAGADDGRELEYEAEGAPIGSLLDGSEQLVGVVSIPWTVRRAFLPQHAGVLHLQALDPAEYTRPYLVREPTLWVDSPSRPLENGLLMKDDRVWLDKEIPERAQGMCRVKLEGGRLAHLFDAANLVKE